MEEDFSHGYLASFHMFTHTHCTHHHIHRSYMHMHTLSHTHREAKDSKGISTHFKVDLSYSLRNNYFLSLEDCYSSCDIESWFQETQQMARFAAVHNLKLCQHLL